MKIRIENQKNNRPSNIIVSFLLVILLSLLASIFLPNFRKIDYKEFLSLSHPVLTNLDGELIHGYNAPIFDSEINEILIPVDIIYGFIDEYIFWDEQENRLTITTENNVIRMKTEELKYFVNNEILELNIPVYNIDNMAYIPSEFLKDFYNLSIEFNKNSQIVNIFHLEKDRTFAKINKKTALRFQSNKKSPLIKYLEADETVEILEGNENTSEKYIKVMSSDGYIGYINKKYISNKWIEEGVTALNTDNNSKNNLEVEGKLNIVFDQVTNVQANNSANKRIVHDGVDVLVPTWFSFLNEQGDIKNIADKNYVNWAHENGYQVWGLITDNFNSTISHAVLSSTEVREHVIKQLLAFVSLYNLDGINIDFESVPKNDGVYFVQFLRELAPLLREQGALLSVDLFVPKSWTQHYNREEVAKVVDYVIVMGYDEHYAGSSKSGSVATLNWSKEAITNTLAQNVPKEKLLLGIPFYTRIWTEELNNGEVKISSKAYGMEAAYDFMIEKGGEFNWLEDIGQYYCEVQENNITYKVWLEDEKSVEKRLDLVSKYDVAGVASWKRGLEKPVIWELLKQKLKSE